MILPAQRAWKSSLDSDLFGSIISSKNINLDKAGYLTLARKAMVLYSKAEDSDFSAPQALAADETYAYLFTTGNAFAVDLESNPLTVTELPTGSQPSFGTQTDAIFYQGIPHATGTTMVCSYSGGTGGTWTSRITGLSSSYPHPMCSFESRQTFVVADGHTLRQYNSSYTRDTSNELVIPSEYVIEWVRYRQSAVYIGTRNIKGGEARMFVWNGIGVGAQASYGAQADWIYSGCEYQSSIAIITSAGRVLRFNGGGFDPLESLPVYSTPHAWSSSSATSNLIGKVASRGMAAHGDILYINLDGTLDTFEGESQGHYLPGQPSGLWVLDPAVGLYHKAGYGIATKNALIPSSVASSFLTFATAHQALTGDAVLCSVQSGITGLNAGQTYYAIVASTTSLKLALTAADALAGRAITVGGSASGDTLVFDTYTSMGSIAAKPGPILTIGKPRIHSFYGSEVLFAGIVHDTDLTSKNVLMSLGEGRNIGSFITPKVQAASVLDMLQKLFAKFDALNLASDQIIVKYRNSERFGLPTPMSFQNTGGTWVNATSFSVDTTGYAFGAVAVGDEIEFLKGAGAGYTAHITAIDKSSSTYVVTIDETLPVTAGQKCDFAVSNWSKMDTHTNASATNTDGLAQTAINKPSTWFQFKIELRGFRITIGQLDLVNAPHQN